MKILFCAAEVVPFAKVGGLSDVVGSLPNALTALGLEPTVVMPRYAGIDIEKYKLAETGIAFDASTPFGTYGITVLKGTLPNSTVPVYFLDCPLLYGSSADVYPKGDYPRELEYFRVFTQAIPELMHALNYYPDILHLHDWHTAKLAIYLKTLRQHDDRFKNMRSVVTIHNLAYQGWDDGASWLELGLEAADYITTVSPNYAREIQTPEFGEGLDRFLEYRRERLRGILNGIDTTLFNPKTDKFIPQQYCDKDFAKGKAACKQHLQTRFGLDVNPDTPLLGFVSRLVDQKGLDILMPALRELQHDNIQYVILGTGDPRYEEELRQLNAQTSNIKTFIGFDLALAQQIYAGSDMFLMPSRFEPCGLGQLIALRYGSVPVVRSVGGLTDTVFDVRQDADTGNGFVFYDYNAHDLAALIRDAVGVYGDQKRWAGIVRRGMQAPLGWDTSAKAYRARYEQVSAMLAV